jgi:hypothetical protein
VLVLGEYPVDRPLVPWLSVSNVLRLRFGSSLPEVHGWLTAWYLPFAVPMLTLSATCALLGWLAVTRSNPWSRVTGSVQG